MATRESVHVALIAAPVSGCGALTSTENSGVAIPLTPEQSNAQVIDAAVVSIQMPWSRRRFLVPSRCRSSGQRPGMVPATTTVRHPFAGRWRFSTRERRASKLQTRR
jgi:hypothetical protein